MLKTRKVYITWPTMQSMLLVFMPTWGRNKYGIHQEIMMKSGTQTTTKYISKNKYSVPLHFILYDHYSRKVDYLLILVTKMFKGMTIWLINDYVVH